MSASRRRSGHGCVFEAKPVFPSAEPERHAAMKIAAMGMHTAEKGHVDIAVATALRFIEDAHPDDRPEIYSARVMECIGPMRK